MRRLFFLFHRNDFLALVRSAVRADMVWLKRFVALRTLVEMRGV
jgi:hypothetical protein